MAEVTVFVDDAVLGRLPDVCAVDGVPARGRLRVVTEVGRSNRLGILWLLLLAGPLGWLALLFLSGNRGEELAVVLPYSDAAYDRFSAARSLRRRAALVGTVGAAAALGLTVYADLDIAGLAFTAIIVVGAIVSAFVAEWRLSQVSVAVDLDASRRWVTLDGVHPAFAAACREHEERTTRR